MVSMKPLLVKLYSRGEEEVVWVMLQLAEDAKNSSVLHADKTG
jgi:hypothetical protein